MKLIFQFSVIILGFVSLSFYSCSQVQSEQTKSQYTERPINKIRKDSLVFEPYLEKLSKLADTSHLKRFEREILKFEEEDSLNGFPLYAALFVGSSSIRKWSNLKDSMKPITVINRGFGGSTMEELVFYFPRIVYKYKPKNILVYEGDNDLSTAGNSPEQFAEVFDLFLEICADVLPDSRIYFISIKPSPARMRYFDKMQKGNRLIKDKCRNNNRLTYINVSTPMFEKNGKLKNDIFLKDRVHMNEKGYEIWNSIIKAQLLDR
ncbi:MAG: GDSL-type esterase/lipase family protein [Bacteroidota bacterium]|nr:GDSL-type esterase/lipase family protein [Bacteroidota bacterium]